LEFNNHDNLFKPLTVKYHKMLNVEYPYKLLTPEYLYKMSTFEYIPIKLYN